MNAVTTSLDNAGVRKAAILVASLGRVRGRRALGPAGPGTGRPRPPGRDGLG